MKTTEKNLNNKTKIYYRDYNLEVKEVEIHVNEWYFQKEIVICKLKARW